MSTTTKNFTLTGSAYTDISEGFENCSFRLRYNAQKGNTARVVIAGAMPTVDTLDYDRYDYPEARGATEEANFTQLASTDRVYVRADRAGTQFDLTAYRSGAAASPVTGYINILDYGADSSGTAGTEGVNNTAFAAAIEAARAQQASHATYGCSAVFVPPGVYRINDTIRFVETDDRISLVGAGKSVSTILLSVSDRDTILFDGGTSGSALLECAVTDLKLAQTGPAWSTGAPAPRDRPAFIRLKNCSNFDIQNVLMDGPYNGIVAMKAARLLVDNVMIFFRSDPPDPEPYAGILITSDPIYTGASSRIYLSNIDISMRGTLDPCCTYGILIECADGLQANLGHINYPRHGVAFIPDGVSHRDVVGGVHFSDFYFDTVAENNVVLEGTAPNYGRIFFDSCRFRDAGVDGFRIAPDVGTIIDELQVTGGVIDLCQRMGLYCLTDGVNSLMLAGTEFRNNNQGNTALGGDMVLKGTNVSIKAATRGGGALGTSVRLDSTLTGGVVEVDTSASTAGTKFTDNSTGVQRKPTGIEAQTYTATLTNVTNITTSTFQSAVYFRFDDQVIVYIGLSCDPTAAAASEIGISLPVASDFTSNSHAIGGATSAAEQGRVDADTTNNRLRLAFTAITTTTHSFSLTASYRIL